MRLKNLEDENYFNEAEVSVDNEGNIAGYLATIDEYVEMLFKSAEGTDNKKLTEIAYRIQNAVDDIRTRELGLKPSLIRAKFNETNVEEDIQDDRKYQSLEELRDKLEDITAHVRRLGIMDSATEIQGKPVTGTGDIHDQLITMSKSVQDLQGAVARALKVVPGEQNPDVQKFNKKYKKEAIQVREAGSPWTTTGKHPEKMTTDELWTEIAVFDELQDRGETLSPKDMMRLDSLFSYLDTAEMNEAIKRKADSMMESAVWKAKRNK